MAKQFDESKKFGRVRGIPGVLYEQGGQLFDAQKRPVDVDGQAEAEAPAEAPVEPQAEAEAPAGKRRPPRKAKPQANHPDVPAGVRPLREQAKDDA